MIRHTPEPVLEFFALLMVKLRQKLEFLLELLSSGMGHDAILADYEDLEREDLLAALAYATRLARTKRVEHLAA